jgi:hypothetical protein
LLEMAELTQAAVVAGWQHLLELLEMADQE